MNDATAIRTLAGLAADLANHSGPIQAPLGANFLRELALIVEGRNMPMSMGELDAVLAFIEALRNEITA